MNEEVGNKIFKEPARLEPARYDEVVSRVSNSTSVVALAKSINEHSSTEGKQVVLSCIGVQAVSTAVKAVAKANSFAAPQGYYYSIVPSFQLAMIEVESGPSIERTVVSLIVLRHRLGR